MNTQANIDRRDFLKAASLGATTLAIPSFGYAKTEDIRKGQVIRGRKVNVAAIGCGSKGAGDIAACEDENVVALCDVDFEYVAQGYNMLREMDEEIDEWGPNPLRLFPKARRFKDYRVMLREMDEEIDAVTISTPDHVHFPAAMMAITMAKHVFVQKPLTLTVEEARLLTLAARKHNVVTVMGNQGHCGEGIRLVKEWVEQGFIGEVREVHIWHGAPEWPQGFREMPPPHPVPEHLDWNLWLNIAPVRPYSRRAYHPNNWRAWWDFGGGALGDMGCHLMDAAYWALDLGAPTSVIAEAEGGSHLSGPRSAVVTYEFAARGNLPPVTLKWYDGGNRPPRPEGLEDRGWDHRPWGQYIIGSKATIYDTTEQCTYPEIIPKAKMREVMAKKPKKTIPRVPGERPHGEWLAAIKGEGPTPGSNFDYAGPLTEAVNLGNVAVRMPGTRIEWDGPKLQVTNSEEANALLRREYREF